MGFVLADQQGWLDPASSAPATAFSDTVVLQTFDKLREAVNSGAADFFMWEYFTSKRYYDSGAIRKVGEIYTPWTSWKIVASTALVGADDKAGKDGRVKDLLAKLDQGIAYFNEHQDEAVNYISSELDYSAEDAREWLKTVKFPARTAGVQAETVQECVEILRKAGVLVGEGLQPEQMVATIPGG
jgi:ABC-type nitrate/sulfonate/bicarbonate transport system substrate-binding protein